MIYLKSKAEIEIMRQAGRIVATVLAEVQKKAKAGVSTEELDRLAESIIIKSNAIPTFKGYRGYPATINASINEELVHGIPHPDRVLKDGDILSVDVGATFKGYVGDAAVTFAIGDVPPEVQQLIDVTRKSLEIGIAESKPGRRSGDVSAAIQACIEGNGLAVVREYTGHGVGREMHEEPQIPNFGIRGKGVPIREGMTYALEPMVNMGTWKTRVLSDNWTVVTADGKLSAHFEHTIAVTSNGAEILTTL